MPRKPSRTRRINPTTEQLLAARRHTELIDKIAEVARTETENNPDLKDLWLRLDARVIVLSASDEVHVEGVHLGPEDEPVQWPDAPTAN